MKANEVMGLLQSGKPLVMGEYRRVKAEVIRWRDKQTRAAMEAPSIRYTVETPDETFEVSRFQEIPDGKTADQMVAEFVAAKPEFQKGQRVVVEIHRWEPQNGVVRCRGVLHPVSDS